MISRKERWIAVLAAGAVFAILLGRYLVKSHLALISLNNGVDWAHHVALIDALIRGADLEVMRPQLVEFSDQPHGAHVIAAVLAKLFGLSSLQTVHIVANAAVIVSCVVTALRLVVVIAVERARSAIADVAAFLVGIAGLAAFAHYGLGFSGQLQWNYFFHQAVGTAVALLCLVVIQWTAAEARHRTAIMAAIPLLSWMVALFHTVPAIWFAASASACILAFPYSWPKRFVAAAAVGLVSAAAIFSLHASRKVLAMGQEVDSDFNIAGLRLSHTPVLLAGGALALAILLCVRFALGRREIDRLLNAHAGAVGLAVMAFAFLADYVLKRPTGFYAYAKPAYIFAAEVSILAAGVTTCLVHRVISGYDWKSFLRSPLIVLSIIAATLAQGFSVRHYLSDQSFLLATQKTIYGWPKSTATLYPLFDAFAPWEKYYLFIAPMGNPRNAAAYRLLTDRKIYRDPTFIDHVIPPHMLKGAIRPWSGMALTLSDGARQSVLLFTGAWDKQPDGMRWIVGAEPAHLFAFVPQYRSMRMCLQIDYHSWTSGELRVGTNGADVIEKIGLQPDGKSIYAPVSIGAEGDLDVALLEIPASPTDPASLRIDSLHLLTECTAAR